MDEHCHGTAVSTCERCQLPAGWGCNSKAFCMYHQGGLGEGTFGGGDYGGDVSE